MAESINFFDENNLISRLTRGLIRHPREVIFLLGSPLSMPTAEATPGVPGVAGIIQMIREEFTEDQSELADFGRIIEQAGTKAYQAAFNFLLGTRGQSVANEIVRRAVLSGMVSPPETPIVTDEDCRRAELEFHRWWLSPATESIGALVARKPGLFGGTILTTNFDPMLEVAVRRAGGQYYKTTLHSDGNLSQTEAPGCHIVHLHGYWYGSDTLHTTRQLVQDRPRLKGSITHIIRDKLIVVCGYGGWDDVFTQTLLDLVRDDAANLEILWTLLGDGSSVSGQLYDRLSPGISRGRVSLYSNIDCNSIFPKIAASFNATAAAPSTNAAPFKPTPVPEAIISEIKAAEGKAAIIEGDDEDRPPLVEVCFGRENELAELSASSASTVFITGIGGEGKSTLAASYFDSAQKARKYNFFVWRDCKEEGERFENQLAQIVEALSEGALRRLDLAKQDIQGLIDLLLPRLTTGLSALFVFDNADHYVNLEQQRLTGGADLFVRALLNCSTQSQVVFTCRTSVAYESANSRSIKLGGISLLATQELFAKRGSTSTEGEISQAHQITNGHAFWLDLLALQVAKRQPPVTLTALTSQIESGEPTGTDRLYPTLSSIWQTLTPKQQLLLRAMAETVRPETEIELAEYLQPEMTYQKFASALRALRAMNLVVVKIGRNGQDLLELHPVVRKFVRQSFSANERIPIIRAIVRVYQKFMGVYQPQLKARPSLIVLQRWTQAAELDIAAGYLADAITTLAEVSYAFSISAYVREFVRVVRILLESFDWVADGSTHSGFSKIFHAHISGLCHLGLFSEADKLMNMYDWTVSEKDVRYISYCEMRCSAEWLRGDLSKAVEWGRKGRDLKRQSDVDTSSMIEHTLALAERDAGAPELALPIFLDGRSLGEITDPAELDENRNGAFYGNVGRCLDFMGQTESALICYQKSAILIEKDVYNEHVINQGYIRWWIGESLLLRQEDFLGAIFLEAARLKWQLGSPQRAQHVEGIIQRLPPSLVAEVRKPQVRPENICLDWIQGRVHLKANRN